MGWQRAQGLGVSSWNDERLLKLSMMVVAQICEYTKDKWIVQFGWIVWYVNCMICEISERICLWFRRPGFDPWVGKIPWRREWQSTPVFLSACWHVAVVLRGPCGHHSLLCVHLAPGGMKDVYQNCFEQVPCFSEETRWGLLFLEMKYLDHCNLIWEQYINAPKARTKS